MATDKLTAASGDTGEMIKQARVLGQATAQLIQSIKVSGIFVTRVNFEIINIAKQLQTYNIA